MDDLSSQQLELLNKVKRDIISEKDSGVIKEINKKINSLKKEIDRRFEEVNDIDEKIDSSSRLIDLLENDNSNKHSNLLVLLLEWVSYLQDKKDDVYPDELISKKGRLNNKKRVLKNLYKGIDEI
jgi:hypothetical protein